VKTAVSLPTLALVATSASAHAEAPTWYVLPPPEYDHPYTKGQLTVVTAKDQQEVRDKCQRQLQPGRGARLLHSRPARVPRGSAPDDEIKRAGFVPDLIKRHEIGHCNGWPADHKGARPWQDWAE
jgi:hypothetical protein